MTSPQESARRSRAGWSRSVPLHAAALFVVLAAVAVWLDNGHSAFPDEGLMTTQVRALSEGTWVVDNPIAHLDPFSRTIPMTGSEAVEGGYIPYARHPSYPLLLVPFWSIGGYLGMMLFSALSVTVAALGSALIAARLRPGTAIAVLWIVGVGSPAFFDAFMVVAHSVAMAFAAILGLVLMRFADRPGVGVGVGVALSGLGVVLFRGEGVLFILAAAAACGLLAVFRRSDGWQGVFNRYLAAGAILGAVAVGGYVIDVEWARRIYGDDDYGSTPTAYLIDAGSNRLSAVWPSLLRPFSETERVAALLVAVAAVFAVAASLIWRLSRRRREDLALLVLGISAAIWLVRVVLDPDLVTGLLSAVPLLLPSLLLVDRVLWRNWFVRFSIITSGVFVFSTLAISYPIGGAAEWGGRYFHLMIPILVPVCVAAVVSSTAGVEGIGRRVGSVFVAVLLIAPSVVAVRESARFRTATRSGVDVAIGLAEEISTPDGGPPVIFIASEVRVGLSRLYWPALEDHRVIASIFPDRRQELAEVLRREGIDTMVVVSPLDVGPPLGSGWAVTERVYDGGSSAWYYVVEAREADD